MRKVLLPLLLCSSLLAFHLTTAQAGDKKTGFLHRTYNYKGKDAKYVLFVPADFKGQKDYPLILFLHGAGETGTDGEKQVAVGLGKAIRDKKEKFPFIAVFPQSQQRTWKAGSDDADRALGILEAVRKEYQLDGKRIYLTGLSMGGSGTWSLAAAYPDMFAAIAPICGGGDPANASRIKHIPCWAFCGDKDSPKLVEKNRDMIKALKGAGGEPRYSEYPFVGHNSWDCAYVTGELYTWFLKHSTK